jgi:hypothetical protein
MLDSIFEHVLQEWNVIWAAMKAAPGVFTLFALCSILVIYGAVEKFYSERIDVMKAHQSFLETMVGAYSKGGPTAVEHLSISPQHSKETKALTSVIGKSFKNQKVVLDGFSYSDCSFENITFEYSGGTFALTHNHISGGMLFSTKNEAIDAFIQLINAFGFLKIPVLGPQGVISPSNPVLPQDNK